MPVLTCEDCLCFHQLPDHFHSLVCQANINAFRASKMEMGSHFTWQPLSVASKTYSRHISIYAVLDVHSLLNNYLGRL
ncbi:hypothetical protein B0H19DRAFT_1191612 [Mycena capillaripes]|nr:hypothetical protein B0H19DRAFT_1191612 [Mycena capillaripes]